MIQNNYCSGVCDGAIYSPSVQAAIHYIDAHLCEKITLDEMAAALRVCRSTLVQSFRREIGISLYAYIIKQRLQKAQTLMTKGVAPIQAAVQAGFGDYSTFYRAFRKEFHVSPTQWKEMQRNL